MVRGGGWLGVVLVVVVVVVVAGVDGTRTHTNTQTRTHTNTHTIAKAMVSVYAKAYAKALADIQSGHRAGTKVMPNPDVAAVKVSAIEDETKTTVLPGVSFIKAGQATTNELYDKALTAIRDGVDEATLTQKKVDTTTSEQQKATAILEQGQQALADKLKAERTAMQVTIKAFSDVSSHAAQAKSELLNLERSLTAVKNAASYTNTVMNSVVNNMGVKNADIQSRVAAVKTAVAAVYTKIEQYQATISARVKGVTPGVDARLSENSQLDMELMKMPTIMKELVLNADQFSPLMDAQYKDFSEFFKDTMTGMKLIDGKLRAGAGILNEGRRDITGLEDLGVQLQDLQKTLVATMGVDGKKLDDAEVNGKQQSNLVSIAETGGRAIGDEMKRLEDGTRVFETQNGEADYRMSQMAGFDNVVSGTLNRMAMRGDQFKRQSQAYVKGHEMAFMDAAEKAHKHVAHMRNVAYRSLKNQQDDNQGEETTVLNGDIADIAQKFKSAAYNLTEKLKYLNSLIDQVQTDMRSDKWALRNQLTKVEDGLMRDVPVWVAPLVDDGKNLSVTYKLFQRGIHHKVELLHETQNQVSFNHNDITNVASAIEDNRDYIGDLMKGTGGEYLKQLKGTASRIEHLQSKMTAFARMIPLMKVRKAKWVDLHKVNLMNPTGPAGQSVSLPKSPLTVNTSPTTATVVRAQSIIDDRVTPKNILPMPAVPELPNAFMMLNEPAPTEANLPGSETNLRGSEPSELGGPPPRTRGA